ncbi:MAG: hypothetical protein KGS60_15795 [Verrucomicrobia bacterium]|nr:hypothetical protein [Verrucomicrobiota bacterium]
MRNDTGCTTFPSMGSGDDPSVRRPRRSACADQSLAAELERVSRMTVEERIKAALSMGDRLAWLNPAPAPQPEDATGG